MRFLPGLRCLIPRFRTALLATISLSTVAGLVVSYLALFHIALPIRRAHYLELAYLRAIESADFSDSIVASVARGANETATPHYRRINRLVEGVEQLHHWSYVPGSKKYHESLGLNRDGSGKAEASGKEYWIYIGGTSSPAHVNTTSKSEEDKSPRKFTHRYKGHSCRDPKSICSAFNTAFNDIAMRWHGAGREMVEHPPTTQAMLRYADCDVTPYFCSLFFGTGVDPVHLVHLKIDDHCRRYINGDWKCPVMWCFIDLPVRHLPWTRWVTVELDGGGSTLVPTFPSAEEQLWSVMSQPGAETYELLNGPPSEDQNNMTGLPAEDAIIDPLGYTPFGLLFWALFNANTDNLFDGPTSARELQVRCYMENWLDTFLKWWDGPPVVVYPGYCAGVMKAREQRMAMQEALLKMSKSVYDHTDRDKNTKP